MQSLADVAAWTLPMETEGMETEGWDWPYASYSDMHACIHEVDDSFLSGHPPSLNLPN